MASLEDKILGEKLHNYCSSSEDEGSEDEGSGSEDKVIKTSLKTSVSGGTPPPVNNWNGVASNTGPKGVLEDWRKYKQLETENQKELERERIALAKKLTLTVKTETEEDADKAQEEVEDELNELIDEGFLMKYQQQRMKELMAKLQKAPKFGKVKTLENRDEFLNAIDKEDPKIAIIVHIYSDKNRACQTMDGCINILATEYPSIKFCRIAADITGLSQHFRVDGVPALLVYKSGQVIGNFVQLATELGNDFFATDVEKFLLEYGMLPEN